uniref:Uncharacterized protein n=1 Tax=Oryza meridionalis TaxID=40149 RepID=A0A0E0FAA2_9ORYZ
MAHFTPASSSPFSVLADSRAAGSSPSPWRRARGGFEAEATISGGPHGGCSVGARIKFGGVAGLQFLRGDHTWSGAIAT